MNIQIGASQYDLDLELFDTVTPVTVANFLNYVDDSAGNYRYDKSFIHRSVTDFVIQGGGYTFDPAFGGFEQTGVYPDYVYPGGLQEVPADASIINETDLATAAGLSNVRGTIAMARMAAADSATSQWFINLVDNAFLDTSGGSGYAVFGRILDKGIDIVDQVAAVPVIDMSSVHSAFSTLPLDNYVSGDPVTESNLVRVNSVRAIQRPILKFDIDPVDYSLVPVGSIVQKILNLSNIGNADLVIGGSSLSALAAPYTVVSDACSNTTLSPNSGSCSVIIEFAPTVVGSHSDELIVTPSVNPLRISSSLAISGEGVPTTAVLFVKDNISTLDFSSVAINTTSLAKTIVIQNRGGSQLDLSAVSITGVDAGQFLSDTGCSSSTSLLIGETCTLSISFNPTSEGQKTALLTINSNAGLSEINLTGNGAGPEIELSTLSIDFGFVALGDYGQNGLLIYNNGLAELEITDLVITGVDATDFSSPLNTCPSVNTLPADSLGYNGSCAIGIKFTPSSEGVKTATLVLTTTDSDEVIVNVTLTGESAVDSDGVAATIEQNAPNNGDANNDGYQDNVQSNVASFLTAQNVYATVVSAPGTLLKNVALISNPSPVDMPAGIEFKHGIFQYTVIDSNPVVQVVVYMPVVDNSNTYYKYGATPDDQTPHWYDFSYDGTTGAQYVGRVDIQPEGITDAPVVKRNMFILNYIDGQRGDDDLTVDGKIVTTGALTYVASPSGDTGLMSWYSLFVLFSLVKIMRRSMSK